MRHGRKLAPISASICDRGGSRDVEALQDYAPMMDFWIAVPKFPGC